MKAAATIALATLAGACSSDPAASPKPVATTLKIDSNMKFGTEFDEFRLNIQQKGYEAENLNFSSRDVELPAFRHIVPGAEKRPYVTVSLEAFLGGVSKGKTRDANFYIPEDYAVWIQRRAAESKSQQSLGLRTQAAPAPATFAGGFQLDLLMDGLCSHEVFTEDCAEGNTCIAGVCRTSNVDILDLSVFGHDGDTGSSSPACHDVLKCFESGRALGRAECQFAANGTTNVAVALDPQAGVGACDAKRCLLPLDYGDPPHGWIRVPTTGGGVDESTIQIDEALCDAAWQGKLRHFVGFVASATCPTFNVTPCTGSAPPPGPDGGQPDGSDGGQPDGSDGGQPVPDGGTEGGVDFVVEGVSPGPLTVSPDAEIRVRFSAALGSFDVTGALAVSRDDAPIPGSVAVDGTDLVFTPTRPLALLTEYQVRVTDSVVASDGSKLTRAYTSTFTTRDGSWKQAEAVSARAGTSARLSLGPNGEALVVFSVGRALSSARWSPTDPVWSPVGIPNGFIQLGSFLVGSDTTWGAMALGAEGAGTAISSIRYDWRAGSWDDTWPLDPTLSPTPLDVLVHEGQGWGLYSTPSQVRVGTHGGKPFFLSADPTRIGEARLCPDVSGGVTVVYGGPPSGPGAVVSAQTVSSTGEAGPIVEIARDDSMMFTSLRATGDGSGTVDTFWIQQVITPDRLARVMTSRRDGGAWSKPQELSRKTGTFLNQLYVAANRKVTAVAWLDHHVTTNDGGFGTPDVHVVTANGSTTVEAELTPSAPNTQYHPRLVVDLSGNASVVWVSESDAPGVYASRFSKDGGWSAPSPIPGSTGANEQPDVALDADGRGWAVWTDALGVQASRFE